MRFSVTQRTLLYGVAAVGLGWIWSMIYPRWNMTGFGWLIPASLLALSIGSASKRFFGLAYLAAWVHAGASLYWLLFMPHLLGAIAGWLALTAYLACFPACWCWGMTRWIRFRMSAEEKPSATEVIEWIRSRSLIQAQGLALTGAAFWVTMEFAMSHLMTGFPWLLLGASQLPWTPLAQSASIGGVALISFVMVWTSLSVGFGLSRMQLRHPNPWSWMQDSVLPLLVVAVLFAVGYQDIRRKDAARPSDTFRVAMIQPAYSQTLIWDDDQDQQRFETLLELSKQALQTEPDLLIWPEGACPSSVESFRPVWDMLQGHRAWLFFNGIDADPPPSADEEPPFYNAAFLMDPAGKIHSVYRKRHLVLFGENIPFADTFPFLMWLTPIQSLFTPGTDAVWMEQTEPKATFYPLICFEDVMPYLARASARRPTDFLVNLTNDGWFRESAAQFQHASLAAFRSIENGLPMIRCSNNGLTCWVDPAGRMHGWNPKASDQDVYGRGIHIREIPVGWQTGPTLYQRMGESFSWLCLVASLPICRSFRNKRSALASQTEQASKAEPTD